MFERHYGLSGPPFALTPPEQGFFDSESHGKALAYLQYGLQQGEGFIVITGAIGTGKSTVVNRLFAELDPEKLDAARIVTSQLQASAALRMILDAFGLRCRSADKGTMVRDLEKYLLARREQGRRALLVIDEAQNLPPRTLEEIRMLSNLTAGGQSLLQTFLVGQPQFQRVLSDPAMEQFRQRVIGWCHLEPMSAAEVAAYVKHRLVQAGWSGNPGVTEAALGVLHRESGGIPRIVNQMCNRLLLFGALEQLTWLEAEHAQAAIADLRAEQNGAGLAPESAPAEPVPAGAGDALSREMGSLRRTVESHHQMLSQLVQLVGTRLGPAAPVPASAGIPLPRRLHRA